MEKSESQAALAAEAAKAPAEGEEKKDEPEGGDQSKRESVKEAEEPAQNEKSARELLQ